MVYGMPYCNATKRGRSYALSSWAWPGFRDQVSGIASDGGSLQTRGHIELRILQRGGGSLEPETQEPGTQNLSIAIHSVSGGRVPPGLAAQIDAIFFEASGRTLVSPQQRATFRERWLGRYLRGGSDVVLIAQEQGQEQ